MLARWNEIKITRDTLDSNQKIRQNSRDRCTKICRNSCNMPHQRDESLCRFCVPVTNYLSEKNNWKINPCQKDNRKNNFHVLFGLHFESIFFKNLLEKFDFEFRHSIFELISDSVLMHFSTEGLCKNKFSSSVTHLAIIVLKRSTKEPDRAACYDKRFI